MTTRDPRYRDRSAPAQSAGGAIDPTQSLSIDGEGDDDDDLYQSLALGTHEAAAAAARDAGTKIESPNARVKTPPPPAAKRPPPVPKGDSELDRVGQIYGSYKVLELLGKGGMGYVFRAEHVKLGREVALKLLRGDYAKRRDAVARFFQEARTVNRVRHRNIVDVTDFVELDDGTTFIIMELLRGQSLGRWARTGIDLPRALAVLAQICDGLAAAHSVGVVHRDLKPDNVIVVPTSDGAELVKLLDFGVAKLLNHGDEDIGFQTQAGSVIGTPAYMSPEQAGGMAIDHRSDIYSLGAIMYELFCGTPMFRGRSFGEYVRKHLTEMPVPPTQTEAGKLLDPRLEAVIMCCLQKDPNQRYATIGQLRDALLGILGAIETHPPSYATGSHPGHSTSGVVLPHPALAPSVAAVMPTILPSSPHHLLPGSVPTAMQIVQLPSGPYAMPAPGVGYTHHPATYVPARTPLWVWGVGGGLAMALGITAALWLASDDTSPAPAASPAQTRPEAQPITEESARPAFVEVQFSSTPAGGVYAVGKDVELCPTPCTHKIDLQDGGATDVRNFVIRAPGFRDAAVAVDLSPSGARDYPVKLEALPTIATEPNKPDEVIVKTELEPEDPLPSTPSKRTGKRTTTPKKTATKPEDTAAKAEPKSGRGIDLVDPAPPPPKKKEPKKIDQAQTLDPFRDNR